MNLSLIFSLLGKIDGHYFTLHTTTHYDSLIFILRKADFQEVFQNLARISERINSTVQPLQIAGTPEVPSEPPMAPMKRLITHKLGSLTLSNGRRRVCSHLVIEEHEQMIKERRSRAVERVANRANKDESHVVGVPRLFDFWRSMNVIGVLLQFVTVILGM